MPVVESARREWADGHRRLLEETAGDRRRRELLLAQVEALLEELRRRVGTTFTLAELADAYQGAERWSREVVAAQQPAGGWQPTLALVEAAAFHLYSRGAVDYEP